MQQVQRLVKYFLYLIRAKSANSIHSPFVFDLYTNLIIQRIPFYIFEKIEDLRLLLKNDKRQIHVIDFGSGKSGKRRINSIAVNAATSPAYGQLLFRLVNKFKPETILELGTSLGLATLYLASPNGKSKVITLEGSEEISHIAGQNFKRLGIKNIEQVIGDFDITLPNVLDNINGKLDFVFFDGNHRKDATLRYFNLCVTKAHSNTIFVFDDIHWSDGMEEAWLEIKKHPQVRVTIDLFHFGIVFFRNELSRQDFVLRF